MVEMLHDLSGPTWQQTCFLPAAGEHLAAADIALETLGRFRSRGDFALDQVSWQTALHITHAGSGVLEIDGRGWRIGPGDCYVFLPGMRIHRHDRRSAPLRYTWLRFVGRRAEALLGELGFRDGQWLLGDLPVARLAPLLDEIEAAYRGDDHSAHFPMAAAWRALDALATRRGAVPAAAHLAATLKRILDEQYPHPLRIAEIAEQLGVDRSTLYRRFREAYGCGPKTHLDRLRLDHARALLRDRSLAVAEVAARCGYDDPARFGKAFRARFGIAPGRWRDAVRSAAR